MGNGWTWEVLSVALSWACIISIAAILWHYDGKTFPSVPGGITLNAIVSTLATVAKSSLMFASSALLGQMKWDWFEEKPRPLYHLDLYDEACRGPLGATKLLFGRTALSFASLGAIVTVLGLAVDPFVQNQRY